MTSAHAHAMGIHPARCADHEPHSADCPDPCIHDLCPEPIFGKCGWCAGTGQRTAPWDGGGIGGECSRCEGAGKYACETCAQVAPSGFGPTHDGMPRCRSGSIASGGRNAHCTCDTCF